jgi:hypothetical protein
MPVRAGCLKRWKYEVPSGDYLPVGATTGRSAGLCVCVCVVALSRNMITTPDSKLSINLRCCASSKGFTVLASIVFQLLPWCSFGFWCHVLMRRKCAVFFVIQTIFLPPPPPPLNCWWNFCARKHLRLAVPVCALLSEQPSSDVSRCWLISLARQKLYSPDIYPEEKPSLRINCRQTEYYNRPLQLRDESIYQPLRTSLTCRKSWSETKL